MREEIQGKNEEKQEQRQKVDKIQVDIDAIGEQIKSNFDAKDKLRDAYFKSKWDYECQKDYIFYIQDLKQRKDDIKDQEAQLAAEQAAFEEEIKNLPHPYAKEMESCEQLSKFVLKLKIATGLEEDSELVAKRLQQEQLSKLNQEKI